MTANIRTFTEDDRAELLDLFGHVGAGAPSTSLWGHAESEAAIYLKPYMDLEPESLFVAVVDGTIVGYLTGCLDSSAFPAESQRIDQAITQYHLLRRPATVRFFLRAMLDVVGARVRRRPTAGELDDPRWPAHLHVNVMPQVRGHGVAAALMSRWFDRLTDAGSPGCHLQTLVENPRAVRFFERCGFTKHGPTPLVPGLRHSERPVHQQTMVWTATRGRVSEDEMANEEHNEGTDDDYRREEDQNRRCRSTAPVRSRPPPRR